jgi:DNA-binding HxlR family transcriptional regulator
MTKSARQGPYICGIDAALDVVSGKWKGLILWELDEHGIRRFAELRRGLPA